MKEYDEATCVTAGELRAVGLSIPENIPDCAWVLRSSIRISLKNIEVVSTGPDKLADPHIGLTVEFTQPFNWISIDFTIESA